MGREPLEVGKISNTGIATVNKHHSSFIKIRKTYTHITYIIINLDMSSPELKVRGRSTVSSFDTSKSSSPVKRSPFDHRLRKNNKFHFPLSIAHVLKTNSPSSVCMFFFLSLSLSLSLSHSFVFQSLCVIFSILIVSRLFVYKLT